MPDQRAAIVRYGHHDFDADELRNAGPDTAIRCLHCSLPFYKADRWWDRPVGTEPISPTGQPRSDVSRDDEQVSSPPVGPEGPLPSPTPSHLGD